MTRRKENPWIFWVSIIFAGACALFAVKTVMGAEPRYDEGTPIMLYSLSTSATPLSLTYIAGVNNNLYSYGVQINLSTSGQTGGYLLTTATACPSDTRLYNQVVGGSLNILEIGRSRRCKLCTIGIAASVTWTAAALVNFNN